MSEADETSGFPSGKEPSKNPRRSARAALRRRLNWLQSTLHQTELAVQAVFNAPGRTNKREDLERLVKAIADFRATTGLHGNGLTETADLDEDLFERLFALEPEANQQIYSSNTAALFESLNLAIPEEDSEDGKPSAPKRDG